MQTKLSISVKNEPTDTETPQLLNKLRTLISTNINTNIQTYTEFELINKMATLSEKDLKNNKYKDLFHDITIKIKKGDFKNIEKLITKKFIKKTKNIEFCSAFNSARKLFLIYILNLKKAENSREVLLYTNIINNLCLHNPNEFLQNVALMFAGELNLNRGLLRTFVVENLGVDGVAPLLEDVDYKYFKIKTLEEIYNDTNVNYMNHNDTEELKGIEYVENIEGFRELLNNETLELKKLLESGASYNFLKKTQPLPPCYYLYPLQLEDTYFNDLNIRLSVKKVGEFLLNKSDDKEHPLMKFLTRYIRFWLREGSDAIKYECLVVLFKLMERNYTFFETSETIKNKEVKSKEVKEILTYKYKGKSKTAKLQTPSFCKSFHFEIITALTNLDELLFYELLLITNSNVIGSLLEEVDLTQKIKKLIPIFNVHLLKIELLKTEKLLNTTLLIEIYRYTTTDDEKIRVLKEISPESVSNTDIFKFNEKDSKELCKLKISKIKNLPKFLNKNNKNEYLKISGDLFYSACEISDDLFLKVKECLFSKQTDNFLENKFLENIKTYPDAVALNLIKFIKKMKEEEFKEKKEEFVKIFDFLLEFSKTCSYEKYTNVYLCRGDFENLIHSPSPFPTLVNDSVNDFVNKDFVNDSVNKETINKESTNTEKEIKETTTSGFVSTKVLQMTSFSEILYIEATHEILNSEIHVHFTIINQSLIPIFEIQITPLTKLRVKKYIPEFLIKQRSIDKKSFIFELQTNYTAPLNSVSSFENNSLSSFENNSLSSFENKSLDSELPLLLNFVVAFKYSKNDIRKQEVLNLKPLEISIESLLKQPNLKYEEFICQWKSLEWERLQVIKHLNKFNEKILRGFQVIKSFEYKNTQIFNLVTSLNEKCVFVNLLASEASLKIRVRSESRNLVDGVSEYLRLILF